MAESADPQFRFTWSDERLYEQFLKARPVWKEENKAATMKQMNLSGDNFYYYRGAEFDYYRKHLDFYNAAVGRLMEQGIRAVGAARSGGDPEPYFAELRNVYADFGEGRLKEIFIPLPDSGQILDASATVIERQAPALIQSEMAAKLATNLAVIKMNSSNYAGGGNGSSPLQVINAARQSFIDQLKAKYAVEPMYGLDGKTIIGYGGVLGTTVADATRGISDVQITGVDTKTYGTNPDLAKEVPNSKNTMIIVMYGSGQHPRAEYTPNPDDTNAGLGIGDSSFGFDNLMLNLRNSYQYSWAFPSGRNITAGTDGVNDDAAARERVTKFVQEAVTQYPNLTNVILVGYSWGGGQVYEIAHWLTEESHLPLAIVGSVYVDAVNQGNRDFGAAEARLPLGTKSFLNIYQSDADLVEDWIELNGTELARPESFPPGAFFQIDADAGSNAQSHGSIDEYSVPTILRYLDTLLRSNKRNA